MRQSYHGHLRATGGREHALIQDIFAWWTALIERAIHWLVSAGQATRATASRLGAGELEALGDTPAVCVAVAGLIAGAVLRVAFSAPGDARVVSVVAAVAAIAWAAVRLGVMLAMRREGGPSGRTVLAAWAVGTLIWVIAVIPLAALVAWLLSAVAALAVFERSGAKRDYSLRAIAVAWGLQMAVTLVSLIFAGGWAVLLSSRP